MDIILTSAVTVIVAYSTIMLATLAGFSSAARAQKTGKVQRKRHAFAGSLASRPTWRSYDWLQSGAPHGTS